MIIEKNKTKVLIGMLILILGLCLGIMMAMLYAGVLYLNNIEAMTPAEEKVMIEMLENFLNDKVNVLIDTTIVNNYKNINSHLDSVK